MSSLAGRPPVPTALHILRGNPGKRALPENEPQPEIEVPTMPAYVEDPIAVAEWERLCPMLMKLRVLSEADGIALGNLCNDYAILHNAHKSLKATGLLTKSRLGAIGQNPLLKVVATTTDRVSRGLREFGLTPSSRTRIAMLDAKPSKADDPWSKLG